MATDSCTGFEHGVNSTSGGGIFNSIVGTAGVEVDVGAGYKRSGNYGLKCAPTATTGGRVTINLSSASATATRRFYIYIASAPSSATWVAEFALTAGSYPRLYVNPSTGNFEIRMGTTLIQAGPAYTTGQSYLVDWKVDVTTNPNDVRCKIDGGTEFGGTHAQAGTTVVSQRFGNGDTTGPAYECWYDDAEVTLSTADYPIGAGVVLGFSPNADGTHNAGTNVMETAAGTDIGTATAYNLLDDVPLTAGGVSDRVQQTANGTGNYAEVQFADISGTSAIRGVCGYLCYQSATATANTGTTVMSHDSFTTVTSIYGTIATPADMSEITDFFKRGTLTAPGGGWTESDVNAIRARIGYSSDAAPDPYWLALMIEVAYTQRAASKAKPIFQKHASFVWRKYV